MLLISFFSTRSSTPTLSIIDKEFFRGSLSKNPVSLSQLSQGGTGSSSGGGFSATGPQGEGNNEPTVKDLRDHIANDLQMSDSAEMLELLVANKILDINLKLRVVAQVLWKEHVLENATVAPSSSGGPGGALSGLLGGAQHVIQAGGGLSMVFSTTGDGDVAAALASSLPPMVITYRLIGVDGEATEDQCGVEDLVDPEAPEDGSGANADSVVHEARMEREFGLTRIVT